jgi:hypothetical protein
MVLTNKYVGLRSHKQMSLLFQSKHVSAQLGHRHHQVMREKYTNDDGIHIKVILTLQFYMNSVIICILLTDHLMA